MSSDFYWGRRLQLNSVHDRYQFIVNYSPHFRFFSNPCLCLPQWPTYYPVLLIFSQNVVYYDPDTPIFAKFYLLSISQWFQAIRDDDDDDTAEDENGDDDEDEDATTPVVDQVNVLFLARTRLNIYVAKNYWA